ncbi:MAG TPA: pitrilysin family protein [Bacillota bacterium]|nr:pitrilysin family protein [Bacillota bacterium]
MNELNEQTIQAKGYQLHLIPTKKFKTIHFVIKFKTNLAREMVTERALFPYVLRQGTVNYPSEQALQLKLDELYGATLSLDVAKKGDHHIFSVRVAVANEKFIPDESTLIDEAIQLLQEVIFNPLTEEGAFLETIFQREKKTLEKKIQSIVDNKIQYANLRLIDEMFKDERYSLHVHGYVEDLKTMTAKQLYEQYEKMLNEDQIDIYVLGDFNVATMQEKIATAFVSLHENDHSRLEINQETSIISQINEVIEHQEIQQAKLHLGYRTNCTFSDNQYPALQVFNGLFGGFPNSKLFMNVREKHSLAYYASSQLDSHKGVLFVLSGIDHKDYEKAREIIEQQMAAMKQGDFSDDDIAETKSMLINQILETLDHPQGIIELLYQQVVAEYQMPPEQFIAKINAVTKDDVINVAEKVVQDTVFLLTEKSGDHS